MLAFPQAVRAATAMASSGAKPLAELEKHLKEISAEEEKTRKDLADTQEVCWCATLLAWLYFVTTCLFPGTEIALPIS